jgi:hypothetical protein
VVWRRYRTVRVGKSMVVVWMLVRGCCRREIMCSVVEEE